MESGNFTVGKSDFEQSRFMIKISLKIDKYGPTKKHDKVLLRKSLIFQNRCKPDSP